MRRDCVDEECIRLNIVYKQWRPLYPNQKTHLTVRDVEDSTEIPEQQEIPQWCVLCPKNRFLSNQIMALAHYRAWHHKRLLVIGDEKIWSCKCSKMRSHGNDNSARNLHWHCPKCFRPCKPPSVLANHMVIAHIDVELVQVRHLMNAKDKQKHKYPYEEEDEEDEEDELESD